VVQFTEENVTLRDKIKEATHSGIYLTFYVLGTPCVIPESKTEQALPSGRRIREEQEVL
jgi:hypothetical protein